MGNYDHFRFFHLSHAQKEYHMVLSRVPLSVFSIFLQPGLLSGPKKVVFLRNVVYNRSSNPYYSSSYL